MAEHVTASEPAWREAARRERIVRALLQSDHTTSAQRASAANNLGISLSWLYVLIRRYRSMPLATSLLKPTPGPMRGKQLLDPKTENIINATIWQIYMARPKPSIAAVHRSIEHECRAGGLVPPSYNSVKARIGRISPKDLIKARDGAKAAADRFRPVTAEYSANHALEIVQIDHTLVDAIIVDERHRQPIGRPWLSLAIDVASRCVAGFYLTLEHPSAISVAMTMRHAVLPKENWLASLGIAAPWSSSGLPDLIHMDNAREFHGRALRRGCEQYGIGQHFRPIRTPHFGGHIERLIGTTMGAVHLLPGTTFSNVAEKADYRSEATAVMTLAELEQWLALEISGGYHARIHSALKRPPELAWQEMVARRPCALRYPPDAEQFLYDFLPFEHRIVRRDGIRLFNLHYWDPVLTALAGLCEEAMTVKYDPRNLSRVFLEAPDGSHWTIPYRDLRRPAITLFEHRQALRAMAERGRNSVNEQLIFDTVAAQRALIADATQRSKSARKSAQRIVNALTAPLPLMGEAEHSVTYGQDVEILSLPPYEVEER